MFAACLWQVAILHSTNSCHKVIRAKKNFKVDMSGEIVEKAGKQKIKSEKSKLLWQRYVA